MQFGAKFIANAQAPVAVKPSEGALDDPAPAPEAFTRLLSAPRNACCDAPLAQQVATERMVIALVGMQLVGPAARSSRQAGHGRRPLRHQRQAALLKQQVMLAAGFAAIGRIRSGVGTPEGGERHAGRIEAGAFPGDLVVLAHSDQGSQLSSEDSQSFLKANGLVGSMSRRGNCHDNAVAESFFHLLKRERIKRKTYPTREAARQDVFDYIEMFYNPVRRQGYNGKRSPVQFAQQFFERQRSA